MPHLVLAALDHIKDLQRCLVLLCSFHLDGKVAIGHLAHHLRQQGLDPARTVAIKQYPQGQLDRGKGNEVGGGEQPQGGGAHTEIMQQVGCQDSVDHPKEKGEEITGGKGQKDTQQQSRCHAVILLKRKTARSANPPHSPAGAAAIKEKDAVQEFDLPLLH